MYTQVKSSGAMEPYAAKTLLKNLVTEHELTPDSLTTDRSSTMKNMIRFFSQKYAICRELCYFSEFNEELPDDEPKILHLFDIWEANIIINSILQKYTHALLKSCMGS